MSSQPICILIDDDPDDQEIFLLALQKLQTDIKCITADSGIEALQILKQENFSPDYIFLDLNMPRMNGKQCLAEIKKIEKLALTPVIIYSTSTVQSDIMETKELGAADYIIKQSSIKELTRILSAFFSENQ